VAAAICASLAWPPPSRRRLTRQVAVSDLAAAGGAHAPRLAHGGGGEEVLQVEALLLVLLSHGVDALRAARAAQRGHRQRLRLATREQRGAVGTRQRPRTAPDRAHVGDAAAVGALPPLQHQPPHDGRLDALQGREKGGGISTEG
jgi:hypothetical protein